MSNASNQNLEDNLLRAYWSKENLPREQQLAWRIAKMASNFFPIDAKAATMVRNRMIDNAGVALASIGRRPVVVAREMALACKPGESKGAFIYGVDAARVPPNWAAWANGTAVRELDFHDTYLAADYSHPGDNIPPILAVAQSAYEHFDITGERFIRAVLVAYEVQVALVRAISLHKYAIDHIAHLCLATAAGLGTLLSLETEIIYQAIGQALHVSLSTRQSRKGEISSWKAYAPAHSGKLAIEAVDRAMRGERSPSPIFEGEDAIIAQILGGMEAKYNVQLPPLGSPLCGILETYTKEHSAEYQAQALIDLAFDMRKKIADMDKIKSVLIETSHHTHKVIGTGAGDPQKFDANASRETLDHSIMYIFAVALLTGEWHHERSYAPQMAKNEKTIRLWNKISTKEVPAWTERYHSTDPHKKAFGGKVIITLDSGEVITEERALANAHSLGKIPFEKENYIKKFTTLTEEVITVNERERFLTAVESCDSFSGDSFSQLNPVAKNVSSLGTKGIL